MRGSHLVKVKLRAEVASEWGTLKGVGILSDVSEVIRRERTWVMIFSMFLEEPDQEIPLTVRKGKCLP